MNSDLSLSARLALPDRGNRGSVPSSALATGDGGEKNADAFAKLVRPMASKMAEPAIKTAKTTAADEDEKKSPLDASGLDDTLAGALNVRYTKIPEEPWSKTAGVECKPPLQIVAATLKAPSPDDVAVSDEASQTVAIKTQILLDTLPDKKETLDVFSFPSRPLIGLPLDEIGSAPASQPDDFAQALHHETPAAIPAKSTASPASPVAPHAEAPSLAADSSLNASTPAGKKPAVAPIAEKLLQPDLYPPPKAERAPDLSAPAAPSSPAMSSIANANVATHATASTAQPADQVGEALSMMVETSRNRLKLQLNPEDLGKVDVTMTMNGGHLKIVISASRPETQAQLIQHQQQLMDALLNSDGGRGAQLEFARPDAQAGRQHTFHDNTAGDAPGASEETTAETTTLRRTEGLVDLSL